jgi:uncharacterized protein YybS (DUF2232 family)
MKSQNLYSPPSQSKVDESLTSDLDSKNPQNPNLLTPAPWWVRVVPYFLSSFFFLSVFMIVFAPLPILFCSVRQGRKWAWLASFTNSLIVGWIAGPISLAIYVVFVASLALLLSEFLKRKKSIERSTIYTLGSMALCSLVFLLIFGRVYHVNPVRELIAQVSHVIDFLAQSLSSSSNLMNSGELDDWKRNLLLEFPSMIAIFSLVLIWANITLLFRVNPNGIRESLGLDASFFKKWKSPEYLVWPTILAGFFLLLDLGVVSDISLNIFRFLMAIYAIQGLSILSYLLDVWGIRGFFRMIGFVLSLLMMMPLVLSLGFFDLWFDFRGKFRQS